MITGRRSSNSLGSRLSCHLDRGWFLPGLLMAALTVSSLASRPPLPLDETRYLSVAWEMHLRGDYLVSHLNGETYAHKPPLLFWLINLLWAVTGVGEEIAGPAARLMIPLVSLISVLLTRRIAQRLWPNDSPLAESAALIHVSLLLWNLLSTLTMFDSLLTVCVQVSLLGVLRAERALPCRPGLPESSRMMRGWTGVLLTGLGLGLGILSKGPVVLVHALPVALFGPWWSENIRRNYWAWYLRIIPCSVLVAAAVGLSWAIPSAMAGGASYRNELLWGQTAGRMVQSFAHREPWWWYLSVLPLTMLPWISIGAVWRRHRIPETVPWALRFLATWIAGPIVVLSAVSGKQVHYLLPVLPAVALMIARRLMIGEHRTQSSDFRFIIWGTIAGGLLPLVINRWPELTGGRLAGICSSWLSVPLLMCGLSLYGIHNVQTIWIVRRISVAAVLFISVLFIGLSPKFWPGFDLRELGQKVAAFQNAGVSVAWFESYHGELQFCGQLRSPLANPQTPAELQAWISEHPRGVVLWRVPGDLTGTAAPHFGALLPDELLRAEELLCHTERLPETNERPHVRSGYWIRRGLTSGLIVLMEFTNEKSRSTRGRTAREDWPSNFFGDQQ